MEFTILLTGRNHALINDFFKDKTHNLVCLSTSMNHDNILNHIKLTKPRALVACLSNEVRDTLHALASLRQDMSEHQVKFVLAGSSDDCINVQNQVPYGADLVITKPFTNEKVIEKVAELLLEQQVLAIKSEVTAERINKSDHEADEYIKKLEASHPQEHAAQGQKAESTDRKHILVIDDDPMMLKIIKEHLHADYDVATAVNGKIALKFLEAKRTDLILLDYEMPVMSGPEVLTEIRKMEKNAGIPVVFLTGTKDKSKVQTALLLKPQGYLLKPIEKDKLIEEITRLLGSR